MTQDDENGEVEEESSSVYVPPKPKYSARPDAPESSMIHIIGPKEPQPDRSEDADEDRPSIDELGEDAPAAPARDAKRRTTDKIAKRRLDELGKKEEDEEETAAEEKPGRDTLPSLEVEIPVEATSRGDDEIDDSSDRPLSVEVQLPPEEEDDEEIDEAAGADTLPSGMIESPASAKETSEPDDPHSVEVEIPEDEEEEEEDDDEDSFVRRQTTPSMKVPIIEEPVPEEGQVSEDRAIVPVEPSSPYSRAMVEHDGGDATIPEGHQGPPPSSVEQLGPVPGYGYPQPGLPWDPATGLPVKHPAASDPALGAEYPYGPMTPAYHQQYPYAGFHPSAPGGYVAPMLALPPAAGLAPVEAMTHVVYRILLPSVEALEGFADTALRTGGVFVRTQDIRPSGTPAVVIVVHPLSQDEFHLPGEVSRVGDHRRGVGVRFVGVTDRTVSDYRNFVVLGIPDDDVGSGSVESPSAAEGSEPELSMLNPVKRQRKDSTGSVPRDTREIEMSKVEPLIKKE